MQITFSQLGSRILSYTDKLILLIGIQRGSVSFDNLSTCASIIIYCLSFLLPAYFILKNTPDPSNEITYTKKLPPKYVIVCVASLGCVIAAGNITSYIKMGLSHIGIGFFSFPTPLPDDFFGIVLAFVSWAAVPAIVEEILFRKAVLGSLLKYGKTFAVITSASAFSLMHCNPSQFLYTFAGGILFALITMKTKSIFPTICLHFINNALSVCYLIVDKYFGETAYQYTAYIADTILMISGLFFTIYLIRSGYFKNTENDPLIKYPTYKVLTRIWTLGYIAYCIFISTQWVYII